jgi:putative copper export protein
MWHIERTAEQEGTPLVPLWRKTISYGFVLGLIIFICAIWFTKLCFAKNTTQTDKKSDGS